MKNSEARSSAAPSSFVIRHSTFGFGLGNGMRFRFKPSTEQRSALRRQLVRLQQPGTVLEILHSVLPDGFQPTGAVCTVQSVHADRFVTRVQARSDTGQECAYA